MRASHGAFTHESILRLPYRAFTGYMRALADELAEAQAAAFCRSDPVLMDDYSTNIEAWRARQPPPG